MDVQKEEMQKLEKELTEAEETLEKERSRSEGKNLLSCSVICCAHSMFLFTHDDRPQKDTIGARS